MSSSSSQAGAGYDHESDAEDARATALDYTQIPQLARSKLPQLLAQRQEWAERKKKAMSEMEKLDDVLGRLLAMADQEAVRCNDHTIKLHVNAVYSFLSEDKLLQNGVAPAVIAQSRETRKKKPYVQVYPPRTKKEAADGEAR